MDRGDGDRFRLDLRWGSEKLIDGVVSDDLLEAMPVRLDDLPFWTSDTVNVDAES